MDLRLPETPVAAIVLIGLLAVASALCLVSSDLPAADAAPAALTMTRSNPDAEPVRAPVAVAPLQA